MTSDQQPSLPSSEEMEAIQKQAEAEFKAVERLFKREHSIPLAASYEAGVGVDAKGKEKSG